MSGTKEGAAKATQTIYKRYGRDYFVKAGAKGGSSGTTGGFYYSMVKGLDLHIEAGRRGGLKSRRRKV